MAPSPETVEGGVPRKHGARLRGAVTQSRVGTCHHEHADEREQAQVAPHCSVSHW